MLFLRTCEALNVSTRRPEMVISAPVCGLRPLRGRFSLTTKFPKPEILTFSPRCRRSFMMAKMDSTTSLASFLENPTFSYTRSTMSPFVMVTVDPPGLGLAWFNVQRVLQGCDQAGVHFVDLHIGQSAIGGAVGDRVREAFLAGGDRRPEVLVEQEDVLDQPRRRVPFAHE